MTREMIITELNNRGYNADSQNSIKNGVVLEGIRISTNSNIAPMESNRQTSKKGRKVYCYFYDMEAHNEEKEIRSRGRGRTRKNVYDKGVFL